MGVGMISSVIAIRLVHGNANARWKNHMNERPYMHESFRNIHRHRFLRTFRMAWLTSSVSHATQAAEYTCYNNMFGYTCKHTSTYQQCTWVNKQNDENQDHNEDEHEDDHDDEDDCVLLQSIDDRSKHICFQDHLLSDLVVQQLLFRSLSEHRWPDHCVCLSLGRCRHYASEILRS